jgi:catechol 2,3-dioxygenase-like lactoylglutathione lyase family enzyme
MLCGLQACCAPLACQAQTAQVAERPAITGIAFARFYTTDLAASEKFYGGTLGFDRVAEAWTSVYPVNASQWIEVVSVTPPKPNARMAAVGFTTRDAAGLQKYLQEKGVHILLPLQNGEFVVRDPEGNMVVFVQAGSKKSVAEAKPSPRATSGRIIHAGFMVQDAGKEDAFWRGILGFKSYWHGGQTDARTDYMSLQVPDGTDWLEYMLNVPANADLREMGVVDHFSLGVAEMSDAIAALARNHCDGADCSKTQVGRDGKLQLNLFDPDLTRVEFMEFVPKEKPCCSPFMGKHPSAKEDK